jgi:hypothetical protein
MSTPAIYFIESDDSLDRDRPEDGYCAVRLDLIEAFEVYRAVDGHVYVKAHIVDGSSPYVLWRGTDLDEGRAWLRGKLDAISADMNRIDR